MESVAPTKVKIAAAAVDAAMASGLADLTVGEVAKAANVSTALVHYHFDTKQALLVAVADTATTSAVTRLTQALGHGRGLETVDRVWSHLTERASAGEGRLAAELAVRAVREPEIAAMVGRGMAGARDAIAARLPTLLGELGATLAVPVEEAAAALAAFLDGLTLALGAGAAAHDVRTAYDAFWLTLIAAGQNARRR
jgi:AcrR family transcriptional regulator